MKKYLCFLFIFLYSNAFAEIVNKIEITGNGRISKETIKVYGDIKLNSDLSSGDINKIINNLNSTDFFEDININLTEGVLKISVKEYPIINSIIIDGEPTDRITEAILEKITLKENGSFIKSNLNQDINLIKKLYGSIGFNFTEVEPKIEKISENRLNLVFFVNKGEKTKITNIYFIGDKKVKDRRLRDIIASEESKFWKFLSKNTNLNNENIELDKRLIKNYYKSIGYYDVQVLSSNAEIINNKTSLTYNIDAGNRYRITKIATDINPVLDKNVFNPLNKEFQKVIGKYYSPFLVKKVLESLDNLIANNNLQFIEHSVSETLEGDSISITINIYEGSKKLVERINVKGNTVTNESVVRGELLIDEGDPYNSLKLDKSIAKLKARKLFGQVKKEVFDGSSPDLKVIDIFVEEKPTGEIMAGAGVGTSGGSVSFNVSENNWLGEGIKLSAFVDLTEESIKGEIDVRNPNYNFSGNELNYNFKSIQNDKPDSGYENTIMATGIGTRFEQYNNIYLSPSLSLTHDDLSVIDSASSALKKQAGTFTDLSFDYGIQLDNRDKAFMPTDGYISSFNQALPLYADAPYLRNAYSFSAYNAITPNVIGAFKFYAATINGFNNKDVRLSKRLHLPSSRLRGFERGKVGPKDGNDYVGGNYNTAINFETNLPNLLPESTKTEVGLFLDIGNVWGVDYGSGVDESDKIRSAAGVNTSWLSPVGPMSFIFATNLSKADTDATESFNFRLGTTF